MLHSFSFLPSLFPMPLLEAHGLVPEDGPIALEARGMQDMTMRAFGPMTSYPGALNASPGPFAATDTTLIKACYQWRKTPQGWVWMGQCPPKSVNGTMDRTLMVMVLFKDHSVLFFKRHPRKNGAGENMSFLLMGALPLRYTQPFPSPESFPPILLDSLAAQFERIPDAGIAVPNTRSETNLWKGPKTPFLVPYGKMALTAYQYKEFQDHDQAIMTLFDATYAVMLHRLQEWRNTHPKDIINSFGLFINGRPIDVYGVRGKFHLDVAISHNSANNPVSMFNAMVRQIEPAFDAVSDSFPHPLAGAAWDFKGFAGNGRRPWVTQTTLFEGPQTSISTHDVMKSYEILLNAGVPAETFSDSVATA